MLGLSHVRAVESGREGALSESIGLFGEGVSLRAGEAIERVWPLRGSYGTAQSSGFTPASLQAARQTSLPFVLSAFFR